MSEPVTIDNCENEPIHIPGAIQPHGVLVACREESLAITQISANAEAFFGEPAEKLLGRTIHELVDAESAARVVERFAIGTPEDLRASNPFRAVTTSGAVLDAVVHRSDGAFLIELEPADPDRPHPVGSFDPRLRETSIRLQTTRDLATLMNVAAREVRRLTGFDRVMVYRFDASWNGQVVAEDKRADLGSFLGQHYPASDIPAQARRLYTRNPIRLIADVNYVPAPLVPVNDPVTNAPLDLSSAALRSVSPIHIEYMKNMGVTASMSISLVVGGELAGLVACHHYDGPRHVSVAERDTAQFIAYQLSWQLRVVEDAERADKARLAQEHEAEVVRSITVASELLDGLDTHALLSLTGATGAAIVLEEGTRLVGDAPPGDAVDLIVAWLRETSPDTLATEQLAKELPAAAAWTQQAGGLLAVAIARELGEFIVWFRPAVDRVVHWAGDPKKSVTTTAGGAPRLSPRGSFELWKEIVRGQSLPWEPWEVEAASRLRRAILGGVRRRQVQLRSMNQRLLDADRAKDDFIATVSHELRTPLNAITGWTGLLKRSQDPAHTQRAIDVIERNAHVQAQLIEDLLDVSRITSGKLTLDVSNVDLGAIVSSVLDSMKLAAEAKSIKLKRAVDPGVPSVRADATRLRQIVSNLVTNAVKFTPKQGQVVITLRKVDSEVELAVIDSGQGISADFLPHVFETFRQQDPAMNRRSQGLGLGLAIARKLVELHGGRIDAESDGLGKGATFRVRLPVTAVGPQSDPFTAKPPSPPRYDLRGKTVLVVEDDGDSREMLRALLEASQGIVTTAEDANAALAILVTSTFDVIVSDVGLPGKSGLELMREYRAMTAEAPRRTPAIALTAFTRPVDRAATLNAGFQAHVPKPVDPEEIVSTMIAVMRAT